MIGRKKRLEQQAHLQVEGVGAGGDTAAGQRFDLANAVDGGVFMDEERLGGHAQIAVAAKIALERIDELRIVLAGIVDQGLHVLLVIALHGRGILQFVQKA